MQPLELCRQVGNWTIATGLVYKVLASTIGDTSGLSVTQYRILARLQSFGRVKRLASLSKSTGLHPSTITAMVNELESMGLCRTDWVAVDRRITSVSCTKRSLELTDEINCALAKRVRNLWELYSTDELKLTCYDSLKTAAVHQALTKYELDRENAEKAFVESVFVNHAVERRYLAERSLSVNGFLVLVCLALHEEGLSPADISEMAFLRRNEVSGALKSLVASDLVHKRQSGTDRRFVHVRALPEAHQLVVNDVAPGLHRRLQEITPEESRDKIELYFSIASKVLDMVSERKQSPF